MHIHKGVYLDRHLGAWLSDSRLGLSRATGNLFRQQTPSLTRQPLPSVPFYAYELPKIGLPFSGVSARICHCCSVSLPWRRCSSAHANGICGVLQQNQRSLRYLVEEEKVVGSKAPKIRSIV
jgi:hypothetical protein